MFDHVTFSHFILPLLLLFFLLPLAQLLTMPFLWFFSTFHQSVFKKKNSKITQILEQTTLLQFLIFYLLSSLFLIDLYMIFFKITFEDIHLCIPSLWGLIEGAATGFLIISSFLLIRRLKIFDDSIYKRIIQNLTGNHRLSFFSWLALATIGGGLLEELVFRGLMFNLLLPHFSPIMVIVFTSFLFSLLHWPFLKTIGLVTAFLAGLILGYSYFLTENLTSVIIAHGLTNFIMSFNLINDCYKTATINSPNK